MRQEVPSLIVGSLEEAVDLIDKESLRVIFRHEPLVGTDRRWLAIFFDFNRGFGAFNSF